MTKVDILRDSPQLGIVLAINFMFFFAGSVLASVDGAVGVFMLTVSVIVFILVYRRVVYLEQVYLEQKGPDYIQKNEHAEAENLQLQKQKMHLDLIRSQCNHEPIVTTVMGGSGWDVMKAEVILLSCGTESLHLNNIKTEQEITILFSDLLNAEVTGPGTVTSNAGMFGGGFGLKGAAESIAIATIINVLTSRKITNTFLRLATNSAEVMLHIAALEPAELRLILSPAFVKMESNKHISKVPSGRSNTILSDEINKLHSQFRDGILTEEEFSLAKKGLLTKGNVA